MGGHSVDTQCPWREPRCTRAYCRREWGGVLAWSRNEGVTDQSLWTPPLRGHSKAGAHPGLTPCPHAAGSSLPNPNRALTTEPHMTATLSNSCLFPFFRTELLGSGRAWCRPLASCPADPAARKPGSGCHAFSVQPTFASLAPPSSPEPVASGAETGLKCTQQCGGDCVPTAWTSSTCSQPARRPCASFENVGGLIASAAHIPFTLPTPPGTEGPALLAAGGVSEGASLDPSSLPRPHRNRDESWCDSCLLHDDLWMRQVRRAQPRAPTPTPRH